MDKTVVKAFHLMELLVRADGPMSLTRLAGLTGLQKSNVHRLLSTLAALGYVRHGDESKLYEPSLRIWEVGQQVYSRLNIASEARPHLRRLVQQTGESAHLAIFDEPDIVYLDKVETDNPVRAYTVVGGRAPAYCTASGKVLLAYQPAAVVRLVCKAARRHTPDTIVDCPLLMRELAHVRQRGYAINLGEFRANVAALAAPVHGSGSAVIAAVGISGPLDRLQPRKIKSLAPKVVEAADAVARVLGPKR
jgi:IclR family transcriptional regulator, KDG regulon repressor